MTATKNVNKYTEEFVKNNKIPYISTIMYKGYDKVYDYAISNDNYPVNNRKMYVYSCTKLFTVTMTMILLERNVISLEDPVEKYIPEYRDLFLIDNDGKRVKPSSILKINHLLTMTGGFSYDFNYYGIYDYVKDNPEASTLDIIKTFNKVPLYFEPGTKFQYSFCHDVLGAVIEVVTGLRLDKCLKKYIFEPLKMNDTFFDILGTVYAPQFVHDGKEIKETRGDNCFVFTKNYYSGGAGAVTTTEDLGKLAMVLANDGTMEDGYSLLKPETISTMYTEQDFFKNITNEFSCAQSPGYTYGLGVRVRTENTLWGLNKGEFGWDGAAGSYFMVDPNKHIAIVMGMNLHNWPQIHGIHLGIVENLYLNFIE